MAGKVRQFMSWMFRIISTALVIMLWVLFTSAPTTIAQSPWRCWELIGDNRVAVRIVTSQLVEPGFWVAVGGVFAPDGTPHTAADLLYLGRDDTGMTFRRREVTGLSRAAVQKWLDRVKIVTPPLMAKINDVVSLQSALDVDSLSPQVFRTPSPPVKITFRVSIYPVDVHVRASGINVVVEGVPWKPLAQCQ